MFHTIRQNGSGSGFVLIRVLDVLTKVAEVERTTDRLAELRRHAELVFRTGQDSLIDTSALADLADRWDQFRAAVAGGSHETERLRRSSALPELVRTADGSPSGSRPD